MYIYKYIKERIYLFLLFQDYNGKDIFIGVTSIGIVVFQNNIRVNTFSWGKIVKISFKKKQFFIQLKREPVSFCPFSFL